MNEGARFDNNLRYYWVYIYMYISDSLISGNDPGLTQIEWYSNTIKGHPQKNGSGAPELSIFLV
jgi:hypothetical protein